MIDRIIFVRVSVLSEFLIFQSNLFHSVITEEKQVFLKKKQSGILLRYIVLYERNNLIKVIWEI